LLAIVLPFSYSAIVVDINFLMNSFFISVSCLFSVFPSYASENIKA